MQYNIDELSRTANVSQRSIYAYIQRRLIPPAFKEGRGFIYSNEHLEALRLVKVLLKFGLPLRQIEVLVVGRERSEIRKALAPILPLAKLLEETENRVYELQRKLLDPNPEELDLSNLGLEDPVALRHNLSEAERQRERLGEEFESSGAEVLRELTSSKNTHQSTLERSTSAALRNEFVERQQLENLERKLLDQLNEIQASLEQMRHSERQRGFIAGLTMAHAFGWQPDISTPIPAASQSEFTEAFHAFLNSLQEQTHFNIAKFNEKEAKQQ